MSYIISLSNSGSSMTLQIKADAESGIYTGVRTVRTSYGASFTEEALASRTYRAYVEHTSTTGFDVDLISLRKVAAISDGDTKLMTVAFYFELHIFKKKSVDSSHVFNLPTAWFPINSYLLALDKNMNFSMSVRNISNFIIQLNEVDPVSKARQIYDSV